MATAAYPKAQIELTLEDVSVLTYVKTLLKQMKGVMKVSVKKTKQPQQTHDITRTAGYREAMADVAAGRVTKYDSLEDFFNEMVAEDGV